MDETIFKQLASMHTLVLDMQQQISKVQRELQYVRMQCHSIQNNLTNSQAKVPLYHDDNVAEAQLVDVL